MSAHHGHKISSRDLLTEAQKYKFFIFVVYADWCGHCQDMKLRLKDKFSRPPPNVKFLEASSVDQSLLDYFPHCRIIRNGVMSDHPLEELYAYLENTKNLAKKDHAKKKHHARD